MKRNFLALCLLIAAMNALAYPFDVIITKSREQVQCIILSSTEELITYQYVDDASQTFTMSTSEIEKIYGKVKEIHIPRGAKAAWREYPNLIDDIDL